MKTKLYISLQIVLALAVILSLAKLIRNANDDKPYRCKILELYQEPAAYRVRARYIAIVFNEDLGRMHHIGLSPEGYFQAKQSKANNMTPSYGLSTTEVNKIKGESMETNMLFTTMGIALILLVLSLLFTPNETI